MACPAIKSKSTERMFKYIAMELEPDQRKDPLFNIIKDLAEKYTYEKQEEFNNNVSEFRFPFGKFKGKKIRNIYADEETKDYVDWVYMQPWLKNRFPDTYKHIKSLRT